jgi:hypothetical protein
MGKSFKKHDYCGHGDGSEKYDKRIANRRLRSSVNRLLRQDPETEVLPIIREVSDVWDMNKDGKSYFGDMKNGNTTRYPHIPYSEDDFLKDYYAKMKRK